MEQTAWQVARMMMRISGTNKKHAGGFTLLELLIVVFIILLASTLIIPGIRNTDSSAFNAQVRQAASALNYARRLAIVESSPQTILFYVLEETDRADENLQELIRNSTNPVWQSETVTLAYQGDINQPPEEVTELAVTFFPQGGSTGGILSFSQDNLSGRIRVDPITGKIARAMAGEEFGEEY